MFNSKANAASSNSGTIIPLPNSPRSPPCCPDGQVENCPAASSNDISPFEIFSFISFAFSSESTNMCFEETVSGVLNSSACSL